MGTPDLPFLLGTDCPAQQSLTPVLRTLLDYSMQPEEPFPWFLTTDTKGAIAVQPPPSTTTIHAAPLLAAIQPTPAAEPNNNTELPSQAVCPSSLPSSEGQVEEDQAPCEVTWGQIYQ